MPWKLQKENKHQEIIEVRYASRADVNRFRTTAILRAYAKKNNICLFFSLIDQINNGMHCTQF